MQACILTSKDNVVFCWYMQEYMVKSIALPSPNLVTERGGTHGHSVPFLPG